MLPVDHQVEPDREAGGREEQKVRPDRYHLADLARRGDRLFGIPDEPLRAAKGARHIEAMIEVAEVLRRLQRFLERGAREAQRGRKALELTLIDGHGPMV